ALTCLGASGSGSAWLELFTVMPIFSCWMTHCPRWTLMWPSTSLTTSSGQKVCWQAR
ncbi:ABCC3 isoform 12, partial [Pongo abelii]